jgi:hypothetical protein
MHAAQRAILIERGFMSSERIAAFSSEITYGFYRRAYKRLTLMREILRRFRKLSASTLQGGGRPCSPQIRHRAVPLPAELIHLFGRLV